MATWPVSLPQIGNVGLQISEDDSVLRSNMDAGPPTRRNRFRAVTKTMEFSMNLSGAQVAVLDSFYSDTLRNGSLSFDWADPRTDSSASVAFKKPPEYTGLAGAPNPDKRIWLVTISLEIQP